VSSFAKEFGDDGAASERTWSADGTATVQLGFWSGVSAWMSHRTGVEGFEDALAEEGDLAAASFLG
jgi:hypothetical protein